MPVFGRKVLSTHQERGQSCVEDSTIQGREQPGAAACGHQAGDDLLKAARLRLARMVRRGLTAWLEKTVAKVILDPERCTSLQLHREYVHELKKATSVACDSSLSVLLYMLRRNSGFQRHHP